MSTHTIDQAALRGPRRLLNRATLRVAGVAVLSVVFALIHCIAPIEESPWLTPLAATDARAVAHAPTTAPADSLDHRIGDQAHTRRN